jgi:NADH-quinone oxidoreductase subunit N
MVKYIGAFDSTTYDLLNLLPEIFLLGLVIFCLIYLSFYAGRSFHFIYFKVGFTFMQLGLGLCFLLHILNLINWPAHTVQIILGGYLVCDLFSFFIKILITFLGLVCGFISYAYYKNQHTKSYEYILLLTFSLMGSMILISSYDLISFYLSMELVSFCLYTLAASRYNSVYSVEAGIKYFIHGCCISGIYVFGVALFFLIAGTTNFYNLHLNLTDFFLDFTLVQQPNFTINFLEFIFFSTASVAILALPFFKVALVPYHFWIADVYEGSPLPITAYFSIVIKLVMVASVIRILYSLLLSVLPILKYIILLYALSSIVVGVLSALAEQKIKRILAFSSISHSGYILIGLVPMKYSSLGATINYTLIYALTNVIIFAFLLMTIGAKSYNTRRAIVYVSDLGLLKNTNFFLGLCFSIALLSFAGLPPFAVFFVKFYIFYELWFAGYTLSVIIMVIMSLISTYYYLRFIKCLFFSLNRKVVQLTQTSFLNKTIIILSTFFLSFYFLWSAYFYLILTCVGISVVPVHIDEYFLWFLETAYENNDITFFYGFRA